MASGFYNQLCSEVHSSKSSFRFTSWSFPRPGPATVLGTGDMCLRNHHWQTEPKFHIWSPESVSYLSFYLSLTWQGLNTLSFPECSWTFSHCFFLESSLAPLCWWKHPSLSRPTTLLLTPAVFYPSGPTWFSWAYNKVWDLPWRGKKQWAPK